MTHLEKIQQERRMAMFMFMTLTKAANEWTEWIETISVRETKHWLKVYKNAGNNVKEQLQKAMGEEGYASFEDDAFMWGDMMDAIRKSTSVEQKQECILIIKEYLAGNIKTLDDSTELQLTEAGMSEHACLMLKNHSIETVGDLKGYIKTNGHKEFAKLKGVGGAVLVESLGVLSKYF
jgi:hypothetical protein